MTDIEPEPQDQPERQRPARWKVSLVIAGILTIQIGNWIATATIAGLAKNHPLWLILLQPTTKNLLLIASQLPLLTFMVVAILRRQLPHPLWFLIGRWYGEAGIRWIRKRDPFIARYLEQLEAWFPRYGWLICLLYPHPLVCAVAGASTMSWTMFITVTFIGIIFYVAMARRFGEWLSPLTEPLVDFGGKYWIPITIISTLLIVVGVWHNNRSGRSKMESVHRIEEELDEELRRDKSD